MGTSPPARDRKPHDMLRDQMAPRARDVLRGLDQLAGDLWHRGLRRVALHTPRGVYTWLHAHDREEANRRELLAEGFDARHGTDTASILSPGAALGVRVNSSNVSVHSYQATTVESVATPLALLPIDHRAFDFVDIGCGKGKPLLIASELPFRRLIGIEISARCIEIAHQNIERYKDGTLDSSRFELTVGDAEGFAFPERPLVVYLFNPFPEPVLARVLQNLVRSIEANPRRVVLMYRGPAADDLLDQLPGFGPVPTVGRAAVYATRPVDWAWPRPPRSS
jgi:SAM-dependent methyltransferase